MSDGSSTAIWQAEADGSGATLLLDGRGLCPGGLSGPDWSPDRSRLSFACRTASGTSSIRILDLSDRTITDLVVLKAPESLDSPPRWSPDGTTIAFDILLAGDRDLAAGSLIATVPAAGGGDARITSFDSFAAYPDWSPDGGRLAYNTYSLTSVQLPREFGDQDGSPRRLGSADGDPGRLSPPPRRSPLVLGRDGAVWRGHRPRHAAAAHADRRVDRHCHGPRHRRTGAGPAADALTPLPIKPTDSSRLPGSQGDYPMFRSLKRLVLLATGLLVLALALPAWALAAPRDDRCAAYGSLTYSMALPDSMRTLGTHHIDWHSTFIDENGDFQVFDTQSQIDVVAGAPSYDGQVLLRLFSNWAPLPNGDVDFDVRRSTPRSGRRSTSCRRSSGERRTPRPTPCRSAGRPRRASGRTGCRRRSRRCGRSARRTSRACSPRSTAGQL